VLLRQLPRERRRSQHLLLAMQHAMQWQREGDLRWSERHHPVLDRLQDGYRWGLNHSRFGILYGQCLIAQCFRIIDFATRAARVGSDPGSIQAIRLGGLAALIQACVARSDPLSKKSDCASRTRY